MLFIPGTEDSLSSIGITAFISESLGLAPGYNISIIIVFISVGGNTSCLRFLKLKKPVRRIIISINPVTVLFLTKKSIALFITIYLPRYFLKGCRRVL